MDHDEREAFREETLRLKVEQEQRALAPAPVEDDLTAWRRQHAEWTQQRIEEGKQREAERRAEREQQYSPLEQRSPTRAVSGRERDDSDSIARAIAAETAAVMEYEQQQRQPQLGNEFPTLSREAVDYATWLFFDDRERGREFAALLTEHGDSVMEQLRAEMLQMRRDILDEVERRGKVIDLPNWRKAG